MRKAEVLAVWLPQGCFGVGAALRGQVGGGRVCSWCWVPVLFYHPAKDLAMAVHGDDFVACGYAEDLTWVSEYLAKCFEIKVRAVLGGEEGDDKEVVMLGRTVRWRPRGLEYEADGRHRRVILETLGLAADPKPLTTNGVPKLEPDQDFDGEELLRAEATLYRAFVARFNFLSQDSPDLQFPAKELSKDMSLRGAGRASKRQRGF